MIPYDSIILGVSRRFVFSGKENGFDTLLGKNEAKDNPIPVPTPIPTRER